MSKSLADCLRYNLWANLGLIDACRGLTDKQLDARATRASRSVRELLQHMVGSELTFVLRTKGRQHEGESWRVEPNWPGLEVLREVAASSGDDLIAIAAGLKEDELVALRYQGKTFEYPKSFFLLHAIEHGVEHRTEIKVTLALIGVETPDLDGWFYAPAAGYGREVNELSGSTGKKKDTGYHSYQYLEPGADHRAFALAKEIDRVPEELVPLSDAEEKRVAALMAREPVVSIHEHTAVFPQDPAEIFEYARQGRQVTGYAGLARSGIDVVFENFMDGTALITSKAGWKWDDIVLDIGMRFSDIDHQELVYVARTLAELADAKPSGRIAFVAALEAATAIENEVDRVDVLYGLGIRCMGITYSEANALGSGLKERTDGGLSDLGRAVVKRMNKLGMTIDVAHCGDQTSLDTIAASAKPIFITHAGARALWKTPRMKPDAVIKACAERGGVIGIEAAPHTTLTEKHRSHSVESVMEHVAYCIDLVGADHVALGPDTLFGDHVALHHAFAAQLSTGRINEGVTFSEVPYVKGMENPGEAMRNGIRWLVKHGYSDDDVRKIAGANALRVLRETWAR